MFLSAQQLRGPGGAKSIHLYEFITTFLTTEGGTMWDRARNNSKSQAVGKSKGGSWDRSHQCHVVTPKFRWINYTSITWHISTPKLGIRGISSNLSSRRSGAFWPLSNCYTAPVATLALGTGCRGEVKSEMVLRGSPLHTWFLIIFGLNFLIL